MTRFEKLVSMKMNDLINVAEKLGIKINKKGSKAAAVEKILAAEAAAAAPTEEHEVIEIDADEEANALTEETFGEDASTPAPEEPQESTEEPAPAPAARITKKPNLKIRELTFEGRTQTIKEWAEELEMLWPTLYDRVNRNGWSVEEALTTPLGQRRKK